MITCCTRDSILFDRKESKLAVLGGSLVKHLLAVMNRPEDYYFGSHAHLIRLQFHDIWLLSIAF